MIKREANLIQSLQQAGTGKLIDFELSLKAVLARDAAFLQINFQRMDSSGIAGQQPFKFSLVKPYGQ